MQGDKEFFVIKCLNCKQSEFEFSYKFFDIRKKIKFVCNECVATTVVEMDDESIIISSHN
jgi:predicted nucleic-acid-binding Zn-ribbon protein